MPLNSPQIRTADKLQHPHAFATHQDLMNLKNEITTELAKLKTDIKGIKTSLKKMEEYLISNSDSNIE